MAHNKKFEDYMVAKVAIDPIASVSGALTSKYIDATGYNRASFIFAFGTPAANASVVAGLGVWQATTSGETWARVTDASFGAISTGIGSNANHVIDVRVNPTYPALIVSGSLTGSTWPISCVCILTEGANKPPTAGSYQIVSPD
jgi:hypothetical protein